MKTFTITLPRRDWAILLHILEENARNVAQQHSVDLLKAELLRAINKSGGSNNADR